jgi:hypothetical protein
MLDKRDTDETGNIDLSDMDVMWKRALSYGLENKKVEISA